MNELLPSWAKVVRGSRRGLAAYVVAGTLLAGGALAGGSATGSHDPGQACHVSGVAPLEFAGDAEHARALVEDWTCSEQSADQARERAEDSLRVDSLVFVPLYVLAVAWFCLFGHWFSARPKARRLARSLLFATAAAGVLDEIENAGLRRVVRGDFDWAELATTASVAKWGVLALAVPFALGQFAGAWSRLVRGVFLGDTDRPEFFGPLTAEEQELPAPLGPADSEIERRRRRGLDPHGNPWPEGRTGIGFSGGGIRAASFALGALHSLQAHPLRPDGSPTVYEASSYLATVSGGGYTGTASQILAHQCGTSGELPLSEGSAEAALLRQRRRFLWGEAAAKQRMAGTREFVTALFIAFGGIGINLSVLLVTGFLVATPLGWFSRYLISPGRESNAGGSGGPPAGLVLGTAALALALVITLWGYLRRGTGPLPRVAKVALVGKVAGTTFLVAVIMWSRFGGWLTLVWLPLLVVAVRLALRLLAVPLRAVRLLDEAAPGQRAPLWALAVSGVVDGLVATAVWFWANLAFERGVDGDTSALPFVMVAALAVGIGAAITVAAVMRALAVAAKEYTGIGRGRDVVFTSVVAGVFVTSGVAGALSGLTDRSPAPAGAFYLAAALVTGVVYLFIDQKRWSLHPMYKARLARTFALTRDGAGVGHVLPFRVSTTLSTWGARPARGPQLLVSAAVYDSIERRPGEVAAWPWVFTGDHVGGPDVGWMRTVDFEAVLGRHNQSDGTLQAAMSISGAAVSPAIGQTDLGPINVAIAAANARLGVWLPSPRYVAALRRNGPEAPTWLRIRRFSHLLREMAGSYDLENRFVYVTDGGQVDNLGLGELLARRCATIICFDASRDIKPCRHSKQVSPQGGTPAEWCHCLNTKTFDRVRESARRRMGVRFSTVGGAPDGDLPDTPGGAEVTPGALTEEMCTPVAVDWEPAPGVAVAKSQTAAMDIHYPDGSLGQLVFAKCLLTPDLGGDARAYVAERGQRRFPSDSTVDQWLDQDQFDAYVAIGRQAGDAAIHRLHTAWVATG